MSQICCRFCEKPLSPNGCSNQCPETFTERYQNGQLIMFLSSDKCDPCDKVFSCSSYKESPIVEIDTEIEKTQREIDKLRSML